MIDLDLLDEQLEQALTDDVRALRGLTPRSHWDTPTPLPPQAWTRTPPKRDEEPAAWEPDDDEWPAVRSVSYVDDAGEDLARGDEDFGPDEAHGTEDGEADRWERAEAEVEPVPAAEPGGQAEDEPEIDFEYELEPEPARERPVAPVRSLSQSKPPPAPRPEREPEIEPVRSGSKSRFAAQAAIGWEKPESAAPPYARSTTGRRATAASLRPTAEPRDAVRARLRLAAAMVAAREPAESPYDSKPLQTPAWQLR